MSEIKGMKEHIANLHLLEQKIKDIVIKECKIFGESWKSEIKKNTPKDTGTLQKNWKKRVIFDSDIELKIYNNTEYAEHVEFGHRTRNNGGIGYVKGFYMLKNSEAIYRQKVGELISSIVEKVEKKCKI